MAKDSQPYKLYLDNKFVGAHMDSTTAYGVGSQERADKMKITFNDGVSFRVVYEDRKDARGNVEILQGRNIARSYAA